MRSKLAFNVNKLTLVVLHEEPAQKQGQHQLEVVGSSNTLGTSFVVLGFALALAGMHKEMGSLEDEEQKHFEEVGVEHLRLEQER